MKSRKPPQPKRAAPRQKQAAPSQQQQQPPSGNAQQPREDLHSGQGAASAYRSLKEWERGRASGQPRQGKPDRPSAR